MKKRDLKLGDFSGLEGETGLNGGLALGDFFCPLPHNPTAVWIDVRMICHAQKFKTKLPVVSFVVTDFYSTHFSKFFSNVL